MATFARFHHLRSNANIRNAQVSVQLKPQHLIVPLFVIPGTDTCQSITSLNDSFRYSVDRLLPVVADLIERGIDKVLLFGVPADHNRHADARSAIDPNGPVPEAIRALKTAFPQLQIFSDICLCAYTDHGHCGITNQQGIDNDATLPILAQMALVHAQAGADWLAPSAMMDGQVQAIRSILDSHGFNQRQILAYSVKFASNLYGPFRHAAASKPSYGDRSSYQMDFRAPQQAIPEAQADLDEGAQALMVKPALHYLDLIASLRRTFPQTTLAAYHVSGEYMMVHHAADAGILDRYKTLYEASLAIRRAGADWIISYALEYLFPRENSHE